MSDPAMIVTLGDLQRLLNDYAKALTGKTAQRFLFDGTLGQVVPPADVAAAIDALKAASGALGTVCQQPVLALRLTVPKI